jgi:hypothetical protein
MKAINLPPREILLLDEHTDSYKSADREKADLILMVETHCQRPTDRRTSNRGSVLASSIEKGSDPGLSAERSATMFPFFVHPCSMATLPRCLDQALRHKLSRSYRERPLASRGGDDLPAPRTTSQPMRGLTAFPESADWGATPS